MDEKESLNAIRRWARERGCRLCVLFGSRGRGGPRVEGDVDIAVEFSQMPGPHERLRIIRELQEAVDPTPVDVVFLHDGTDPVLRFEVFRTGEPLHEERPGLFVDEKVRALALFEDALPFRRARRERLRRMAEGEHPVR